MTTTTPSKRGPKSDKYADLFRRFKKLSRRKTLAWPCPEGTEPRTFAKTIRILASRRGIAPVSIATAGNAIVLTKK